MPVGALHLLRDSTKIKPLSTSDANSISMMESVEPKTPASWQTHESQDTPAVLLTGGTGLVGGGLCKSLACAGRGLRIFVLTRRRDGLSELFPANGEVSVLQGDLTAPQLGLRTETFSALQK